MDLDWRGTPSGKLTQSYRGRTIEAINTVSRKIACASRLLDVHGHGIGITGHHNSRFIWHEREFISQIKANVCVPLDLGGDLREHDLAMSGCGINNAGG